MAVEERTRSEWRFESGEEIVPGRHALQALGGGHRFEVYLVWDEHLHTVVAMKLLRPDRVGDERALRGFRREAEALRRLSHPVLPRSFDTDLDGDRPYLVLEYLEGPRLSTLIRRHGALAVEQAIPLGLQLGAALHYMHAEGMVHLDVKPKNVIMGAPPRLVDLSIATTVEEAREMEGPIGTDAYMAPEQCGVPDRGTIGPPSDVWGLGVTLHEAITGRLPFPRGSDDQDGPLEERWPQLALDPEPMPREYPPQIADPVGACLEHRPEDRPTIAEVVAGLQPLANLLPRRPRITRRRPRI
jgi:eukaryotic-like serine/threonine-protein kinase